MKGRFQPTTVGNMARDANGGYVCHEDYEKLREENARLRSELAVVRDNNAWLGREKERLEAAIRKTLDENGHLADGENCTLITLKRALPTPNTELRGDGQAQLDRRPA